MQSRWTAGMAALALLCSAGAKAQNPPNPPSADEAWQIPITLSVANIQNLTTNSGLTIGTDPSATDGYDSAFDQQNPANPLSNYATITLRHLANETGWENYSGIYIQDYRAPIVSGQSETWNNVTVASDQGTADAPAQIVLTWDVSSVGADIQLTFNDPNDADGDGIKSYDMKHVSSFKFPSFLQNGQSVTYSSFSITATNSQLLTAPVLSNLQLSGLTSTGFNLAFATDVATGATVNYGTSATALNQTITATDATTDHSFKITGLTPNTTYYYQVVTNLTGHIAAKSAVASTQTLQQLSLVGDIQATAADTSAVIAYQTNAPASAVVNYGTSQDKLTQQASVTDVKASQSVTLPNLTAGTTYYYQVVSSALGFDAFTSEVKTFSTLGDFTISDPVISNLTATGATVTVNSNLPVILTIRYGTTDFSLTQTSQTVGTSQVFQLTGLQAGTAYQVRASASLIGYADQTSKIVNFNTLKTFQITGQPAVSDLTATTATIGLTTDTLVTATVNYSIDNSFSLSNALTTPTKTPTFALTGLQSNATYQYKVTLSADGYESITTAPLTFTTPEAVVFGNGDVDGDGKVTVSDVVLAARAAVDLVTLTATQSAAADVRLPKGEIDIADVVWILKIVVGVVTQ